jgi:hypothetical protein
VVLAASRPTIPTGAASTPIARAVLTGEVAPDPTVQPESTGDVDPGLQGLPPSPAGQECLDRIQRGSGWADLCWAGYRLPTLTWTCEGCLIPDSATRGISLYNVVGMPAGMIPNWDLFADVGT